MAKEEYKVSMRISTVGLVPYCQAALRRNIKDAIETHEPALHCSEIRIRESRKREGDY